MLFRSTLLALCALSPLAYSSPVHRRQVESTPARRNVSPNPAFSFNGWHGNSNLNNFDGFFGQGNFNGGNNQQVIIVQDKLVCSQRDIRVVQQKLAILLELGKRIVLEQVCDVVTQVIVLNQHLNGHRQFNRDVARKDRNRNRNVGFDQDVAGRFGNLFDEHGNLSFGDLGFDGFNVGKNLRQFNDNWDENLLRGEVDDALEAVKEALGLQKGGNNRGNGDNNNNDDNENNDNGEEESVTESIASETASETASVAEPTESVVARRSWW